MPGHYSRDVAIAWEVVGELQVAQCQQRSTVQSAFTQYCLANPEASEARMYDGKAKCAHPAGQLFL